MEDMIISVFFIYLKSLQRHFHLCKVIYCWELLLDYYLGTDST